MKYTYSFCHVCKHPNVHVDPASRTLREHYSGGVRCPGSNQPAREARDKPSKR